MKLNESDHKCEDMEGLEPNKDRVSQDAALERAMDGSLLRVFIWLQPFHSRRITDN
jgi:hypothetical protein